MISIAMAPSLPSSAPSAPSALWSPMAPIITRLSPFNPCSSAPPPLHRLHCSAPWLPLHPLRSHRPFSAPATRCVLCRSSSAAAVQESAAPPGLPETEEASEEESSPTPSEASSSSSPSSSSSSSEDAQPSEPKPEEEKPAPVVVELPAHRIANPVNLVVGASRGLGLEFTRQLLAKYPDSPIVATCRNPSIATDLQALKEKYPSQLIVMKLDVTDEQSAEEVAKEILDRYGRLDLYINTVGILHIPDGMQPEKKIDELTQDNAILAYKTNAIGPAIVAKHMLPLLKFGKGEGSGRGGAVLAHVTAKVGSIYDNKFGGWYSYRVSKAALNQFTRTIGVECLRLKEPVIVVLLHPGPVDTDLSKPFSRNVTPEKMFTAAVSVEKLLGVIDSLKPEDCAKFFNYDKFELPW